MDERVCMVNELMSFFRILGFGRAALCCYCGNAKGGT